MGTLYLQLFGFCVLVPHLMVANANKSGKFSVYDPVPGLDPSPYYSVRMKEKGSDQWTETFMLLTECTEAKHCNWGSGITKHLSNWSNSYLNFEMEGGNTIELEITMLFGNETISKAVVHPYSASDDCVVESGKAYVAISHTGLFTVDINGQMDDQDTGKIPKNRGYYDGPPIHTITIFANPFIKNKPSLDDPGVHQVSPGEKAPSEGDWHTLYFLPGIHDVGLSFTVHKNKTYYIPGDALIYATLNNKNVDADGDNIYIYGHGTISGDKFSHPSQENPPAEDWTHRPIYIRGNVRFISHKIIFQKQGIVFRSKKYKG